MTPDLFGLDMLDLLPAGWERSAHLAIGDLREDGALDVRLLLESGTLRYLATIGAKGQDGIVEAPKSFEHLARFAREVLESNRPILRRPANVNRGFTLTVFPIRGTHDRVVFILEPEDWATA